MKGRRKIWLQKEKQKKKRKQSNKISLIKFKKKKKKIEAECWSEVSKWLFSYLALNKGNEREI